MPLGSVPYFLTATLVQVAFVLARRVPNFQPPGRPPAYSDAPKLLIDMFALPRCFLAGEQIKVAIATTILERCEASFHSLEILATPRQMAFVTGTVPRSPPIATAARAGALRVGILRDTLKECVEPLSIADTQPQSIPEGFVNPAYGALLGVQLVGARLALV